MTMTLMMQMVVVAKAIMLLTTIKKNIKNYHKAKCNNNSHDADEGKQ